jgi:hypothetical protein
MAHIGLRKPVKCTRIMNGVYYINNIFKILIAEGENKGDKGK